MRFILTKEQILFFIVTILSFIIIYPFLIPFLFGVAIAYLYEPILNKTIALLKIKKEFWKWVLSSLLVIVSFVAIFGPILTLLTTGIQELLTALNLLESELKKPNFLNQKSIDVSRFLKEFSLNYSSDEVVLKFTDGLKQLATMLASEAGTALTATPAFLIKMFLFILTWIFFMIHGKKYRESFLPKIIPWKKERELISNTVSSVLKAFILVNIFVSFIQAIIIATVLGIFGIPRFALMGIIAFFMSFVPIVGTIPVMLGAAIWIYFSQGSLGAAIGILMCALAVGVLDNLLRPYFMKGGIDLNFFWIFLAIVGGMSMLGLAGALLGPVCFALFVAAIKALDAQKT